MLNARKIKILEAIINDYIATAEPIGSRTIAKKYNLGISSATIRNEMSDLEEMGYIIQPHASAGRIPSDKGYRLYVDGLMGAKRLNAEQERFLRESVAVGLNQIDRLMQDVARAISVLTNYTAAASDVVASVTVSHVQLVPVDESKIALVLVTDAKTVKNQIIPMPGPPPLAVLNAMSLLLTSHLAGKSAGEVVLIANEARAGTHATALRADLESLGMPVSVLDAIIPAILASLSRADAVQVHTSGIKNMLSFPEFSNLDRARAIFHTLEEQDILIELLSGDSKESDIHIAIGEELALPAMSDCSIIKARVRINENLTGNIAIIGPTRMDYSQGVSVINAIVAAIINRPRKEESI